MIANVIPTTAYYAMPTQANVSVRVNVMSVITLSKEAFDERRM